MPSPQRAALVLIKWWNGGWEQLQSSFEEDEYGRCLEQWNYIVFVPILDVYWKLLERASYCFLPRVKRPPPVEMEMQSDSIAIAFSMIHFKLQSCRIDLQIAFISTSVRSASFSRPKMTAIKFLQFLMQETSMVHDSVKLNFSALALWRWIVYVNWFHFMKHILQRDVFCAEITFPLHPDQPRLFIYHRPSYTGAHWFSAISLPDSIRERVPC